MELADFLAKQNSTQYKLKFESEEIDIEALTLLSPSDLRSICGVALGHGAKLVNAAQQVFVDSCCHAAQTHCCRENRNNIVSLDEVLLRDGGKNIASLDDLILVRSPESQESHFSEDCLSSQSLKVGFEDMVLADSSQELPASAAPDSWHPDSADRESGSKNIQSLASQFAREPSLKRKRMAAWFRSSFTQSKSLPEGLLKERIFKRQLFVAGVLPKDFIQHQCLYSLFCEALVLAECFICLVHLKSSYFSQERLVPIIFLIWQLAMLHPFWRQWSKEFAWDGPTCQLMLQMDRRGFPWSEMRMSIRISHVYSVVSSALLISFWYLSYSRQETVTMTLFRRTGSKHNRILGWISLAIDIVGVPSQILWTSVIMPSHVWMVCFAAHLHRFDIFCYAGAADRAFQAEMVHADVDLVSALKNLEIAVTARLRMASDRLDVADIFAPASVAMMGFIQLLALLGPLAMVAESFETDVMRTLNNASILKVARQHIGDQLLPHLQHLDWGFRFGGTTITAKFVSSIALAVLVTCLTSVCQAAFGQRNSV